MKKIKLDVERLIALIEEIGNEAQICSASSVVIGRIGKAEICVTARTAIDSDYLGKTSPRCRWPVHQLTCCVGCECALCGFCMRIHECSPVEAGVFPAEQRAGASNPPALSDISSRASSQARAVFPDSAGGGVRAAGRSAGGPAGVLPPVPLGLGRLNHEGTKGTKKKPNMGKRKSGGMFSPGGIGAGLVRTLCGLRRCFFRK
jgi:hypothetical protein